MSRVGCLSGPPLTLRVTKLLGGRRRDEAEREGVLSRTGSHIFQLIIYSYEIEREQHRATNLIRKKEKG